MRSSVLANSPSVMLRSPTLATTRAACSGDRPATVAPPSTVACLSAGSLQPASAASETTAPVTSTRPRIREGFIGRRSTMISPQLLDDGADILALADAEDVAPGGQLEDADGHVV